MNLSWENRLERKPQKNQKKNSRKKRKKKNKTKKQKKKKQKQKKKNQKQKKNKNKKKKKKTKKKKNVKIWKYVLNFYNSFWKHTHETNAGFLIIISVFPISSIGLFFFFFRSK